ncbi:MAG: hypothetical protein ACXVPU_04375 [Bacteroidia bacterium]
MKKALMITLLAVTGTFGTMNAQEKKEQTAVIVSDTKGWHKIGETTVDFKKEKEEIVVVGADRFASIKFKVTEAPIDLMELEIFYESGDNQTIKVNQPVKSPGESRIIDLNGGERSLKKIVFVYKTLPNRKDLKAHVEIWGLKTNTDKKK